MNSDFKIIGQVRKTQGVQGELIIELFTGIEFNDVVPEWLLFQEPEHQGIPVKVIQSSVRNQSLLLKIEGIDSLEKAKKMIGQEVLCAVGELKSGKEFFEIENGYQAHDLLHGSLGTIKNVIQATGQIILSIEHSSGKEILFPFHEDFFISIDRENKKINLKSPVGLIELYLNG